jgi:uncharacterized protein YecA (UPF0149 family)
MNPNESRPIVTEALPWRVEPLCACCGEALAAKTDSEGTDLCLRCAMGVTEPIRNVGPRVGRNHRCPCGSGSKFKRCCLPQGS